MSKVVPKSLLTVTPKDRKAFAKALKKSVVSDKVIRTIRMVNEGIPVNEAILLGTGNPSPSHDTVCRIKRESENCLSLTSLDNIAGHVFKKAMTGEPIIHEYKDKDAEGKEITRTNVMLPDFRHALASAIATKDRTEPKVQEVNIVRTSIHADLDMSQYRNPKPVAQHAALKEEVVSPELTESNEIKRLEHQP